MNQKILGSMGFAICALSFLCLILLMYVHKKKIKNKQTKVFSALLGLAIILTFCEMGYVYGLSVLDINPKLAELTCRIYTVGNIIWINLLIYYLLCRIEHFTDKDKEKRYHLISFLTLLVLAVIIISVSFSLPLTYESSKSNFYNFGGPGVNVAYIEGAILSIVVSIAMIFKGNALTKSQKKTIYFTIALFVLLMALQVLLGYDYNTITFMFAYLIATLFFTIESQDNKLIQELKISKEKATIAEKAKTEFLINMSHEIRTPMSTILGFSEVLLNEHPLTEECAKRDTRDIYQASSILSELIDTILDISALETKKEKIENEKYNIREFLKNIEEETIAKLDNNISYETSINETIPEHLFIGDSPKMHKIFTNIINYLQRKTQENGKILVTLDYKKAEKNNYQLIFKITSSNCHIPREKFDMEFNDYVKLGENKEQTIDNDDLKLIIAKQYIELLNGRADFKTTSNHCECTLCFIQSISLDNDTEIPVPTKTVSKNILIVDDNKVNHIIISKLLEEYHYNISSAYTEEEYANKITGTKYDLILIDTNFIDETLEQSLKGINKDSILVEMTENRQDKSKAYINDAIYKPVSKDSITKIVYKYLKEDVKI